RPLPVVTSTVVGSRWWTSSIGRCLRSHLRYRIGSLYETKSGSIPLPFRALFRTHGRVRVMPGDASLLVGDPDQGPEQVGGRRVVSLHLVIGERGGDVAARVEDPPDIDLTVTLDVEDEIPEP